MAEMNINLTEGIHAEIAEGNFSMLSNTSTTVDPLTLSYSNVGILNYYKLTVVYSEGVSNVRVLNNGKNSRVSASGQGYFQLQLYIRDDQGNSDTDLITIIVE